MPPLSPKKKAKIEALAKELGVDPKEIFAEAEAMLSELQKAKPIAPPTSGSKPADKPKPAEEKPTAPPPEAEQPKLFMYHLPFVTVNEVRTGWLGLPAWTPEEGGDDIAAAFAAVNSGGSNGEAPVTADSANEIRRDISARRASRKAKAKKR